MPLDIRGRTRATLKESACVRPGPEGSGNPLNLLRARDWGLALRRATVGPVAEKTAELDRLEVVLPY